MKFLTFCGPYAPLSLCQIWLESIEIFRVKWPVACFGTFAQIFRPNYVVPCLTNYISGTKNLRRLKFGTFIDRPEYNRSHPRHRPHRQLCGKGAASKIEKNRNFPKLSRVWRALGKTFQGFSPRAGICCRGAYCLATEQNLAGLHSTVSPVGGAARGLSKNSPLPTAKFGAPNFKILFSGDPQPLKILKIL